MSALMRTFGHLLRLTSNRFSFSWFLVRSSSQLSVSRVRRPSFRRLFFCLFSGFSSAVSAWYGPQRKPDDGNGGPTQGYAEKAKNIAVVGRGIIDGHGDISTEFPKVRAHPIHFVECRNFSSVWEIEDGHTAKTTPA